MIVKVGTKMWMKCVWLNYQVNSKVEIKYGRMCMVWITVKLEKKYDKSVCGERIGKN